MANLPAVICHWAFIILWLKQIFNGLTKMLAVPGMEPEQPQYQGSATKDQKYDTPVAYNGNTLF